MRQLIIPRGFAHGICTLAPDTEVFYKVDEFYAPDYDRAIRWNDPDIAIEWPYNDPLLSEKDRNAPLLKDTENNFIYGEI
jgi:dTDP-4-dehydrorhamnose 3,5-epimerase